VRLEVSDLFVAYEQTPVLKAVNVGADRGECVAVIGPNGAGKSTLLKAIAGIITASSGDVRLDGVSVLRAKAQPLVDRSIVFVPQGKRVFPSLTVLENLDVMLSSFERNHRKDVVESLLSTFPGLEGRLYLPAARLSGGEQQILALARALIIKPKLLLLDEPTFGLSPRWSEEVFERLKTIKEIAVVVVEQNVRWALALADRAYVLKLGRVIRAGSTEEIARTVEFDWGLT